MNRAMSFNALAWLILGAIASLAFGVLTGRAISKSSAEPANLVSSHQPVNEEAASERGPSSSAFEGRVALIERLPTMSVASLRAAMEDGRTPLAMIKPIAERWATIAPETMLPFLEENWSRYTHLEDQLQMLPFDTLFKVWATHDLDGAIEVTRRWSPQYDQQFYQFAMTEIVGVMMTQNFKETLRFTRENHIDLTMIVRRDPAKWAAQIHHMEPGRYRTEVSQKIADEWAMLDPQALRAWVSTLDTSLANRLDLP